MFIHLLLTERERERERERAQVGKGQRERGRHRIRSRLWALSCRPRARWGTGTRNWDHDLSRSWMLNWLSYPGTPIFFLCLFTYFERVRACEWREGQRERGDRESQAGSPLSAQSPTGSSISRTMRSWPEQKLSQTLNRVTQVPLCFY